MSGDDTERELRNHSSEDLDIPAIRIPASGSGGQQDLPDVLLKVHGLLVGAEVKYSSEDRIYIQSEEIESLKRFCDRWGARPVVIVRFSYDTTFYVLPLTEDNSAFLTGSGALSIARDERKQLHELERYIDIVKRAIQ